MSSAGWYPDPSGAPLQRYWDGAVWTEHSAPLPYERVSVVQGPNHALHLILTLFTFWACGGWAWIWLLIAISDKKRVRYVSN
jgi:hypothetical protein